MIESKSGGVKFPDGTTQSRAVASQSGVAHNATSGLIPISQSQTPVLSLSIACPSAGYLVILATCKYSGTADSADNLLKVGGAVITGSGLITANQVFAFQGFTTVTANTWLVEWTASRAGGGSASVNSPQLTAMFFPDNYVAP